MRIAFTIYTTRSYADLSQIGNFYLDSVPTTSTITSFDTDGAYNLTNFLFIKTNRPEYDGEYFVNKSIICMDNDLTRPPVELHLEKNNKQQNTFLYLKGGPAISRHEMFTKIILKGAINKETKSLVIPRTTLDFIFIDGKYYKCEKVVFKHTGEVEIFTANGLDLDHAIGGTI